jgi:hypothetical protein
MSMSNTPAYSDTVTILFTIYKWPSLQIIVIKITQQKILYTCFVKLFKNIFVGLKYKYFDEIFQLSEANKHESFPVFFSFVS